MKLTEENVVEQLKMKNEEALPYLLQVYGGLLKAIIQRYLKGNPQDMEECLSDILVAVWFHIDSFDATKNTFKQWIAAIAKYRAIDYLRKINKSQKGLSQFALDENTPEQQISQQPLFDMQSILNGLTDVEREIFEKYYVKGVPSKEIADDFHARESWVHNKLSRGRRKLKTILLRGEV
ncbi:sigma-70 family RNA polymerase sigma factor [Planomicrobium okeanokoites]|uniref:Sigma-70 family RNA polymerase sigma factor n=1 Tax=Planomicrobium okeanokoites TaxID=244 RepID=A0ABV7KT26_PLAOK|nr:sigma-70 family RNA polymerase sigma factor [Planomicrobium okeanokoites]TAA65871.1 sigma-70 family RNA polymerase sigma factor [Planomicrobium okeanokoites]